MRLNTNWTIIKFLMYNIIYVLFTVALVYFGVLQGVVTGEYSLTTVFISVVWFLNGIAVIILNLIDLRAAITK